MKEQKSLIWIVSGLIVILSGYIIFLHVNAPKIGYVRTGIILENYAGMIDTKNILDRKIDGWQANLDTLELNYQKSLDNFNKDYKTLKEKERAELKLMLEKQLSTIDSYAQNVEKMALDENQKLMQGTINQINDCIKRFGEKKGYSIIYGITSTGNILYGNDKYDLTNEILEELNREYQGVK
ncbi:MAG: OmpH family outer membrane protein [Cytophagaceae bacterium]